jgi:deazaflavin-dependent oxidoreductase (nitroreductase family)
VTEDRGPAAGGAAIAAALVADGRAVRLETVGRVTGRPVPVTVGFVEEPDGTLLVSAGDPAAAWAANLAAEPRCRVTRGTETAAFTAEPLDAAGQARAVRELIVRYGTPSERLGAGPSFRLRKAGAAQARR